MPKAGLEPATTRLGGDNPILRPGDELLERVSRKLWPALVFEKDEILLRCMLVVREERDRGDVQITIPVEIACS